VQSHVTTASLQSEISAELSYLLPFDESANFENLLLEIESRSKDLGIPSFDHYIVCPSFDHCLVCPSSFGHCIVCPSSFGHCIVCPSSIFGF
jgi:hypothetical protein